MRPFMLIGLLLHLVLQQPVQVVGVVHGVAVGLGLLLPPPVWGVGEG